jgi:protein Tex
MISEHAGVRGQVREKAMQYGRMQSRKIESAEDPKGIFQNYYEFELRVSRLRPHQILALNRGEREKILRVRLDTEERDWLNAVYAAFRPDPRSPLAQQLELAIRDAGQRLLLPAVERSVRALLTESAESHAITVFASNLRGLLMQSPLSKHTVLGIDPGFRTGCKVAVVDATGKVLDTATIYPHEPQKAWNPAKATLDALITKHGVTVIAIGNGTAARETERLAAEITRARNGVQYVIVSEAGASVYSASELARAELPTLDVTLRGAVSIARRVQDPLAELVKIDPKSIGVGMYQHDVDQKQLATALDSTVESVVNHVGVDVNTASPALLTHVAGIGPKLAERIVNYRQENGAFPDRASLRKVTGLGAKAFEQAAGFLRVRNSTNPLDASAIHPESYKAAQQLLKQAGVSITDPLPQREAAIARIRASNSVESLAEALKLGVPTLQDILEQLVRPGRDPRADLPPPILRSDVLSMDDLLPGMRLQGTVRNVVDFGVFVDIGVKQDGLLHRSQIPEGVELHVSDTIEVEILNVDKARSRIGLGLV